MEVTLVSANYAVKVGDAVMVRADGDVLPVEMVLGYVRSCRHAEQQPWMWQIEVTPAVDLQNLRQVIVVVNRR